MENAVLPAWHASLAKAATYLRDVLQEDVPFGLQDLLRNASADIEVALAITEDSITNDY